MKENFAHLMQQAAQMQQHMKKAQEELSKQSVTGESGAGMVKIEGNCRHDVLKVSIDPSLLSDHTMLEELIMAAVNDLNHQIEKTTKEKFSSIAGGIPIPDGLFK